MKKIKLMVILGLITGFSGLILTIFNDTTQPIILEVQSEKEYAIYQDMFPDMTDFKSIDSSIENINYVNEIMNEQNEIGYVISSSGANGYGDITALVGIDMAGNIIGLNYSVFNQTPGFGDKVKTDEFLSQFSSGNISKLEIDGATGATYSSNLVKQLIDNIKNVYEGGL